MKRLFFLLFFLFYTNLIFSQTQVDFKNFKEKALAELIYKNINEIRDSLGLRPLLRDSILELAAKSQSLYIKKVDNLVHTQEDPNLATLELRIDFYKGSHEKVSENLDQVYIDKPYTIYREKETIKISTYEMAAYAFTKSCINTSANLANITDRTFYTTGIGFSIDEAKKCIFIAQVFGSMPFTFPPSVKAKENKKVYYPSKKASIDNAYGLQHPQEKICGKCVTAYNGVSDHIEKGIRIEKGKVFFIFGDLSLFQKIFPNPDDAVAVDIIRKEQFSCNEENILHRSFAHDGVLLKPVSQKELLKNNTRASENILYAWIGDIPPEIIQDYECRLLIIRGNMVCQTLYNNPPAEKDFSLVHTELFLDSLQKNEILKKKSLRFTIPFEKDKFSYSEKDIKPIYDSLELNKFNITEVNLFAYASVEGSTERNHELQKKRAESIIKVLQSFQLESIKTNIKAQENWDQFYREIKNTPFAYLASLDKEVIKQKLQQDSLAKAMEHILKRQRKAVLFLKITEKIDLTHDKSALIMHFISAMSKKDVATATTLQSALFDAISAGELNYEAIELVSIPKTKEFAQMINNDIIFRYLLGKDFNYIKELEDASALDPSNPYIKYNIYDLMLKDWKEGAVLSGNPDPLLKNIKSLYNTKIDKKLVHRLYLNFQMLSTQWYLENKKYKAREDAAGLVKKYYKSIEGGQEDLMAVARYFDKNNKQEWALEILFPIMQKGEYNEEMLFTFLSIAVWKAELFEKKELEGYIMKATELNPEKFCRLLGAEKLFFPLLKHESLKSQYCSTCIE